MFGRLHIRSKQPQYPKYCQSRGACLFRNIRILTFHCNSRSTLDKIRGYDRGLSYFENYSNYIRNKNIFHIPSTNHYNFITTWFEHVRII